MECIRDLNIIGAAIAIVAGTLLHFIYTWYKNICTAILGAVNESTWEHLKLLFWPVVIWGIAEYLLYGKLIPQFLPVKVISIVIGMLTIIILFYTYTGIVGHNILIIDILTFIIGVISSYIFSYWQLVSPNEILLSSRAGTAAVIALIILIILFILFTFVPPHIGLFLDPVSKSYGINASMHKST